jgi:hypothetical protein
MRRKVIIIGSSLVSLAVLAGVAWAVWGGNTSTHVSLQLSAKPAAAITFAATNDDELVKDLTWDPGDTGPDPSSGGPQASRYTFDAANCVAALGPTASEASLTITTGYGSYYCAAYLALSNPVGGATWKLTEARINGTTLLADCPTMTTTDLDANTIPDIESCVAKMGAAGIYDPILNSVVAAGAGLNGVLSLHVLDTATGGMTKAFDFTTVGVVQP